MIRAQNPVAAGSSLSERSTARPGNVDMAIFGSREGAAGQGAAAGQGTVNENYQQQTEADNPEPESQDEEESVSLSNCIITTALEELVIDQPFEISVDVSASIGDASGTVTFRLFCTLTDADGNEDCQDQSISFEAVISGGAAIATGTLVSPKTPVPVGTSVKYHVVAEHGKAKESHESSKVDVEAGKPPAPLAVWSLGSVHFGFDSSFVMPSAAVDLTDLSQKMTEFSGAALAVFGHADPVGDDAKNKVLSGRRAYAIHSLLTRKTAGWLELSKDDKWDLRVTQTILSHLKNGAGSPYYSGSIDGKTGAQTKAAIKAFQKDNGLTVKETPDTATLTKLYELYMDSICPARSTADDFVGDPSDARLQWACSGCGEFNPLLVFSKVDESTFSSSSDKTARNAKNAPNRRATIALFPETAKGPGKVTFPCPDWKSGSAKCKAQFFDDADARRSPTEAERTWEGSKDTFACKFYAGISTEIPVPGVETPADAGKPIRFDGHCHLFNADYLLDELKVMWKDPIILVGGGIDFYGHEHGSDDSAAPDASGSGVPAAPGTGTPAVKPAKKSTEEMIKDCIKQLEQVDRAGFTNEESHLDAVLDAAKTHMGGDYRVAAVPLMMDIYYMFTPPLTKDSTASAAAFLAPVAAPLKQIAHKSAGAFGDIADVVVDKVTEGVGDVAMDVLGSSSKYLESPGFFSHRQKLEELKGHRPNELFPFFAVDPRRPGVVDHLLSGELVGKDRPFQGVKLYPRLGVHPACAALEPVFAWCESNQVPIVTHTSEGGFPQVYAHDAYCDPRNFEKALKKHPNLYIDFAHFGGVQSHKLGHWQEHIIALMMKYPNVYADLSCVVEIEKLNYFKERIWVRSDAAEQARVRERTIFGTDYDVFFFGGVGINFDTYYNAFAASFTPEEMLTLSHTNPAKFLSTVFSEREPYAVESKSGGAGFLERKRASIGGAIEDYIEENEYVHKAEAAYTKGKQAVREVNRTVAKAKETVREVNRTVDKAKETARQVNRTATKAKETARGAGRAATKVIKDLGW